MSGHFILQVLEGSATRFTGTFAEPVELGRQIRDQHEKVFNSRRDDKSGKLRVVIAPADDDTRVSRVHVQLSPIGGGRVRIENASTKILPVRLADGTELKSGAAREMVLPASFTVGGRTVTLGVPPSRPDEPDEPSRFLGQGLLDPSRFPTEALVAGTRIEVERVLGWLKATMTVLQSAANSSDFFQRAAQAVVDVIGLDSGRVMLWSGEGWKTEAQKFAPEVPPGLATWEPSRSLLNKVWAEKKTVWWDITPGESPPTPGFTLVAAAPILDRQGGVLGVLYGDRRSDDQSMSAVPVRRLEAVLLEILAGGVAAGLARIEQEKATLTAHAKFEQFFTPELARQLANRPGLLQGRECEVTVLVCEVRGFSSTAERLGPVGAEDWIGDVLGTLSACVLDHRGVLVDYTDDRLLAMWGAPEETANHPAAAARAGLDMIARLPELSSRWQPALGELVRIGVGLSTGVALVGNVGSRYKFKYGPLGNTVSLAGRVQELTREWGCPLLATGTTRSRAGTEVRARRLGTVPIPGVADAVDLYELTNSTQAGWDQLGRDYERALERVEAGAPREAALALNAILAAHPGDVPTLKLLTRAVGSLASTAR